MSTLEPFFRRRKYQTTYYFDFTGEVIFDPILFADAPASIWFIADGMTVHSRLTYAIPFSEDVEISTSSFTLSSLEDFEVECAEKAYDLFSREVEQHLFDRLCSYSVGLDTALYDIPDPSAYPSTYWMRICDFAYYQVTEKEPDDLELRRVLDATRVLLPRVVDLYMMKSAVRVGLLDPSPTVKRKIQSLRDHCRKIYPDDWSAYFDQTISKSITMAAAFQLGRGLNRSLVTQSRIIHASMTYRELFCYD